MKKTCISICLILTWLHAASCLSAPPAAVPREPVLPDGLGVNIHFTDPRPGEMKMLAEGGFRWVRMDLSWSGTEREKGRYDFSRYDRLMAALEPHGIRALLILDYVNRFYDDGQSPRTEEGRKAFARWTAAAVKRYQGRGVLWEMYNEPNIRFWRPEPNVEHYIKLALEVGEAIRKVAPEEAYIGPATSEVDFDFIEACFRAGLLEYWSAVSVHPYRRQPPETAAADYAKLRRMIDKYAPAGKKIPIISGEWGYSAAWSGMTQEDQGMLLPRQWLTNLANDVPLSIWYDWHDDGSDRNEPEHNFGTVRHAYHADRDPVYDPKPAYLAAKTLSTILAGFRFNKRLAVGGEDDYVLLFSKGDDVRVVAWSLSKGARKIAIPASPGRFTATGHMGRDVTRIAADKQGLSVSPDGTPRYYASEKPNDLLRVAAAWERVPSEIRLPAQKNASITLSLPNPLTRPIRVIMSPGRQVEIAPGKRASITASFDLPRDAEPKRIVVQCEVQGMGTIAQATRVMPTNPLRLRVLPPMGKNLPVRVENPAGEAFQGTVRLTGVEGVELQSAKTPLTFTPGETEATVHFVYDGNVEKSYRFGVRVEDEQGDVQLTVPAKAYRLVDDFSRYSADTLPDAYRLLPDGDPQVASTQAVIVAEPPAGLPSGGAAALRITYRFEAGWKFVRLVPQTDELGTIEGRPTSLGLWVHGDGSGNQLRLRFTDATGQTFQPGGEAIRWKGWRYVVFSLDGTRAGHWGGAGDGTIHYPVRCDSLLLIDSAGRRKTQGEIYIASPMLVW